MNYKLMNSNWLSDPFLVKVSMLPPDSSKCSGRKLDTVASAEKTWRHGLYRIDEVNLNQKTITYTAV